MTKSIVLAPIHDTHENVFYVKVLDDSDGWELFRGDPQPTLEAASHDACLQLLPGEHVADILEPEER